MHFSYNESMLLSADTAEIQEVVYIVSWPPLMNHKRKCSKTICKRYGSHIVVNFLLQLKICETTQALGL